MQEEWEDAFYEALVFLLIVGIILALIYCAPS